MKTLTDIQIHTADRAGKLFLSGHYSNLNHAFSIIGSEKTVAANYVGQVSVGAEQWEAFDVPSLGLRVYGRDVSRACNAYLTEADYSRLMQGDTYIA